MISDRYYGSPRNVFVSRARLFRYGRHKTLLKGAGIVVLAVILLRLALWLLGVVIGVLFWGIQLALSLLFLGLLVYGAYWAYTTFVSDSKSTGREREKVFER